MGQVYSSSQAEGAEQARPEQLSPPTRVFIGLRVAPEIASQLAQFAAALERPSVRQVAPADIHLTLVPPWNETSLPCAISKLAGVVARFGAFPLLFQYVGYGPQPRRPRLLWAECAASDEIAALRMALLLAFGQTDERPFQPHVTLARIRAAGPVIARKHPINQPVSLTQQIESVELFQSPPAGQSGYQVLTSLRLGRSGRFSAETVKLRRPATDRRMI